MRLREPQGLTNQCGIQPRSSRCLRHIGLGRLWQVEPMLESTTKLLSELPVFSERSCAALDKQDAVALAHRSAQIRSHPGLSLLGYRSAISCCLPSCSVPSEACSLEVGAVVVEGGVVVEPPGYEHHDPDQHEHQGQRAGHDASGRHATTLLLAMGFFDLTLTDHAERDRDDAPRGADAAESQQQACGSDDH